MLRLQTQSISSIARRCSSSSSLSALSSCRNFTSDIYKRRPLYSSAAIAFPPSRCFSVINNHSSSASSSLLSRSAAASSSFLLPSHSRYFQTNTSQDQSASPPPPEYNHFVAALMLLGNAGKDLSVVELETKLMRVISASGIMTNEREVIDFLKEEHRIVKCNEEQLVAIAMQLCIEGGEEQPSNAQVQRVLEAAGVEMDSDRIRELVTSISQGTTSTPLLEGQGAGGGQIVPAPKSRWGALGAIATGAAVLAGKTKYVLVALKLTKMTPLISMMVTSFAYSFVFGWPYAIGMVGQLLLHESGHAAVMRHYGIPFSPMVFVPFMGAMVTMKDSPRTAYEEAMVAFGGPVMGAAGAAGLAVVGAVWGSPMLVALADFGLMINLFNLLPIGSLDGGRIASALSPWLNVAGLAGGGLLLWSGSMSNPIFYLIMLAGTYTTVMRFVNPPLPAYTTLSSTQRLTVGLGYLGLIFFLLWAMRENNRRKLTPKQIQAVREGRMRTPPPSDPEAFYTDESWDLSVTENPKNQPRWG